MPIVRAAIDGASASRAVQRALADERLGSALKARPLYVLAAGKASASMVAGLLGEPGLNIRRVMAVCTHRDDTLPAIVEWHTGGHPLPDERSVAAADAALALASQVGTAERLHILLSGGASALLAHPIDGLLLRDKQWVVDAMLKGGADITALNTVRKHLSSIKGGRLAARCRGTTITWAVSDVVGDDLAVIGSGPTVGDPTTWHDADAALRRFTAGRRWPREVCVLLEKGLGGAIADTPKPDDPALARSEAHVIARCRDALNSAEREARALGYHVAVRSEPVIGEARLAAREWLASARQLLRHLPRPACLLSGGETTVKVVGQGRGGRNQEFALALVEALALAQDDVVVASVGSDGIDGSTDAAGAIVDVTSAHRAREAGLGTPDEYLTDNNAFAFFDALGDLIRTGRTDTNVGDIQALLVRSRDRSAGP